MTGTLVLDCEAVQALYDPDHPKHLRATELIAANAARARRGAPASLRVVVPVAVRIEAGWDRTAPTASNINRITQAVDVVVQTESANEAVRLRSVLPELSVVDATVGAVVASAPEPVRILTSDLGDMNAILDHLGIVGSAILL